MSEATKPRRPGRPTESDEPRTAELRVRLTKREMSRLKITARRLGQDVSELVRGKLASIIEG